MRALSSFFAGPGFTLAAVSLAALAGCGSGNGSDGSGDGGAGGATTTTTTHVECKYPTAGFAPKPGGVIPNAKWQGFVNENEDAPTTVALGDYLDCDGSKGINALLVDVSATWCEACQVEAQTLPSTLKSKWDALGIQVLTLMIQDAQYKPATTATALAWKKKYNLVTTTVAADPQFYFQALAEGGGVGLPFLVTIDPRTMTLVGTTQGYPADETAIENLATKNQMQ
jgi:hypothetical protein